MSAPKHTPGPWHVSTLKSGQLVYDGSPQGFLIADASGYARRPDHEREANACLIAAAPELLAALKAQRCFSCLPSEPDDDVVCDNCRARRAAIAKAEGEP